MYYGITDVESINGRSGLRMVFCRRPKSVGTGLANRLFARSVCDVQRRCMVIEADACNSCLPGAGLKNPWVIASQAWLSIHCSVCDKLHLRHKQINKNPTKKQTDRRQESNLVHVGLKMCYLVAIFLRIS